MKSLNIKAGLCSISAVLLFAQAGCSTEAATRNTASVQATTVPYSQLQTKVVITPGQTYLSFMEKQVKPGLDAFDATLRAEAKAKPNQYSTWQTDMIASGTGVAVRIDDKNYFFNIGYNNGSQTSDIQSGRSYGVGPTGRQSDPSDEFYLDELEKYLTSEPTHVSDFYNAVMMALTNCDTSGWAKLSVAGQMVATDFMAIYTAESDRHLMVRLAPSQHPWEIDLAATTFVSLFDATTGKINQETDKKPAGGSAKSIRTYQLNVGSIGLWWAKGIKGSGIGETRNARTDLTRKISGYEEKNNPEVVKAITDITKMDANTDMIQDVFQYLNTTSSPMIMSAQDSKNLNDAVVGFIIQVQKDSQLIADEITGNSN